MNYKKMEPELKLKYIHNHISTVKEWAQIAIDHLEWAMEDINFIKSITVNEKDDKNPG